MSQNIIVPFLCHNYAFEVPCECDRSFAICQECLFYVDQKVRIRNKYSSTIQLTFVRILMGLRNGTRMKCFAQVTAKSFFKGSFHQHGKSFNDLPLLTLSHVRMFPWHLLCVSRWRLWSQRNSMDRFRIKVEFCKFLSCRLSFSWSWRVNTGHIFASAPGKALGWGAETQGWLIRYCQRLTPEAGQLKQERTHLNRFQLPKSQVVSVSELACRHRNIATPLCG